MTKNFLAHLDISAQELAQRGDAYPDGHLRPWIARQCGLAEQDVREYAILRRSLDARRKPDIRLLYALRVTVADAAPEPQNAVAAPAPDETHWLYQLAKRPDAPQNPLIIGAGPAGMMAAYLLALHGCQPVILERGCDVDRRAADVAAFRQTRQLNPDSNYLFGEGGAGTFSDGKLFTRVKDDRMRFLLEAYVAARAPRRILYDHHPHIGSDILPFMVKRLRQQIEAWGGTFRWGAEISDIFMRGPRVGGVVLRDGERLDAPVTLIGCGHSARGFIRQIVRRGAAHRLKDFQIGCRIEHPQEVIDRAQYGWIPPRTVVGAAEYTLTSRPPAALNLPNVTTFCMCPGGEIIAATSDAGQLCANGMSRFRRDSPFANAGLIVNQDAAAFASVDAAFEFLEELERRAFAAGASDAEAYCCPAQSARAFARGEAGLTATAASYHFGLTPARLDLLLPQRTAAALRQALPYFENVLPGFLRSGTLIGVETRVSSPVRFERNPDTLESSLPGLYLVGEGAGQAGGITSAALDGLRAAETILTGKPAMRRQMRHNAPLEGV